MVNVCSNMLDNLIYKVFTIWIKQSYTDYISKS
ncbi:hypothetical protein SAMN05444407_105292 [Chryseobacterium contaminans]|uniref:Uncharacterized protein n=1 Tax=Chryseobacterium contaminans TaxID=1423959 RepID=A0A1M7CP57_9FLAO|nr:hypothetical protein SAMN05444407_105292 [Chryseobacterium contaminans]